MTTNPNPDPDFDGCRRTCRQKGTHTRVWGECEHGAEPEPTVSLSRVYTDTDGFPSIGFDSYTVAQLGELITAGLRASDLPVNGDDLVDIGVVAARAIVHRNDVPDPTAVSVVPPATNQTAVLRWAADELGRMDYDTDSNDYGYDTYRDAWNGGVMDGADLLRRLAAEAPHTETPDDEPAEIECAHCWRLVENRGAPNMGGPQHDHWVHVPGGFTVCSPQRGGDSPRAEPKPAVVAQAGKETAAGVRQDGAQS